MTFTQEHLRFTFGGSIGAQEQWSSGLRFGTVVQPGETALEDLYDQVYAWLSSSAINMCSYVRLNWVKLALVGIDGRYPDGVEALYYENPTGQAGPGQTNMPPQVSLAVTLETGVSRGRAHRGRMYLPPASLFPESDGRLTQVQATNAAVATASFLDLITNEMGAPVWVMSDIGTGTTRVATDVSVGRTLDTQRRRRRSIDEARVEVPINP